MAVQPILSSDTLETGFRQKYNTTINEIIVGYSLLKDNTGAFTKILRLVKYGGGFINVDLSSIFYTQAEIGNLITGINSSPYSGAWDSSKSYDAQSVVDANGTLWRSLINNNTDQPGTTTTWFNILSGTGSQELIKVKDDFTIDTGTGLITYTYLPGDIDLLGSNPPLVDFYVLDTVAGQSQDRDATVQAIFGHEDNDLTKPVNSVMFSGVDSTVWDAGNFQAILRAALNPNPTPIGSGNTNWKSVATYAAMIASGTPTQMTVFKVANDESTGNVNAVYEFWPDGILTYQGISGGGGTANKRAFLYSSSDSRFVFDAVNYTLTFTLDSTLRALFTYNVLTGILQAMFRQKNTANQFKQIDTNPLINDDGTNYISVMAEGIVDPTNYQIVLY